MSELFHLPHREVKPHQIALPVDGVGAVIATLPFEFISLPSSSLSSFMCLLPLIFLVWFRVSPTSQHLDLAHQYMCALLEVCLWLLGLSSSVLIFCCFSVIVVLLSRASVEGECVFVDVDEGNHEQIKVESVLLSQSIGSLGKFRQFCGTGDRLIGLRSYEFEVVIIVAGAGAAGGSLGVHFAIGTPSTCMQYSNNAVVDCSRGTKRGTKQYKLRVRHRQSILLFFFLAIVVH